MGVRKGLLLLVGLYAALAAPAAAQPLGRWALDEGAGQSTADLTGRGHDGFLGERESADHHDPAWIPGRFGTGLRFDADRDLFVSIRNPGSLLSQQVSVEAWVRRLGSPGRWRYVFSSGSTECFAAPYGLYSGFQGGLAFYVSDGSGYVLSPEAVPADVWDGNWHYAVGTYDGQRVRLYVDGVELARGTPAALTIGYGSAAGGVFIGTYHGSCSRPFSGDIDEVTVHDRALSPNRVNFAAVAAAGRPLPPQVEPVTGPPASRERRAPGRCLTVRVTPRRVSLRRQTRVLIEVRRGRRPAAGRRVAIRGAGLRRTVRTGPKGRARLTVRASRRGRLRVRALGAPARCSGKSVKVAPKT